MYTPETPQESRVRLARRLQEVVNCLENGPEMGILTSFSLCYMTVSEMFGEEHLQRMIAGHMETKRRMENNLCLVHGKPEAADGFCDDCTFRDREEVADFDKIANELNCQSVQ